MYGYSGDMCLKICSSLKKVMPCAGFYIFLFNDILKIL